MRFVYRILDFYLDSSMHVALAVYALARVSMESFDIFYDECVAYFIFYGTIVSYNFIKYGSKAKRYFIVNTPYVRWIQVLSFVAFGLTLFYAYQLSLKTLVWAAGIGLVSLMYILPFLPNDNSMRTLSGLKIYIVAFCWAATTVWLPLVNNDVSFSADVFIALLQCFLFVLVITLPFEIRDLRFDSERLATIPQQIGVRKTKVLGLSLLLIFYLLSFFKDELTSMELMINFVVVVVSGLFLGFSQKKQTAYYSSLFVEGIPIFWFLLFSFFT